VTFLTPVFFLGLGAIAIPILIHLIQREKKRVVEFPSLMFVRRIPYQSVRRRRIRHWFLLFLRAAAIALIVFAFARPFLHQSAVAAAAGGAARDVVVLLDQSASMGYGDHFEKAKDAARRVVRGLGADDRATLVLFAKNAEENMRATSDRARLEGAINAAKVTAGATRYGPALKLADSILSRSPLKRRARWCAAWPPAIAPPWCCSRRTPRRTCAPPPTARGSKARSAPRRSRRAPRATGRR